jgi:hypothetical protein
VRFPPCGIAGTIIRNRDRARRLFGQEGKERPAGKRTAAKEMGQEIFSPFRGITAMIFL